jgi:putative transposase
MRFSNSIFGKLLEPINRRWFQEIVDAHDGDAYDKSFKSWDHLLMLTYGQLSGINSLRGLETSFNANSQHHYHLGVRRLARSTLSDANARRPVGIFAQTFTKLSQQADRQVRRDGSQMLRLIDASPIPLGKLCEWARWNGRIRGLKMHVVYDPQADVARRVEITSATTNDIEVGRQLTIEPGATYVFDKGYYHFGWWQEINDNKAFFVTRVKTNTRLRAVKHRTLRKRKGEGFTIIADDDVVLTSKGDSRLPIPLRRIWLKADNGRRLTLITNDRKRTAVEIAALYKARWQIELLFRWIKQHLDIRKFLGTNENAIRLQVIAAMIAYLLLRIAARANGITIPILRFTQLVSQFLLTRRPIGEIQKPPPVNPRKPKPSCSPNQLAFCYT